MTGPAAPASTAEAPGRRIPFKRKALYIAICWLLFLSALGVAEGLARMIAPRQDSLAFFIQRSEQADFTAEEAMPIFTGDPLLTWRLKPDLEEVFWDYTLVSTNSRGLRQPGEVGPKPKGTARVVCFGDSVTFGYRIPVVFPAAPKTHNPDHLPYPVVLEDLLGEGHSQPVEVVNMGVPGYSSHQGLARARRDLARYRPDIVVICFGWNDTDLRPAPDQISLSMGPAARIRRFLLEHSRLIQWLSPPPKPAEAESARVVPVELTPRVSRERYVSNMLAIAEYTRKLGAKPVIVGPVYRDRTTNPAHAERMTNWRTALRDAASGEGILYLEIPELMESAAPGNTDLFGEVIHPNDKGARLMARAVAEFIEQRKLIGE